jgi:hypothetical protein
MDSGFQNEKNILNALHGKSFDSLNKNLQLLIQNSFTNYDGVIKCVKEAGRNKSDLKIIIKDESHTYSVKKGSGNSIHQEKIEPFLEFLDNEFSISENTKNSIRFFIWGDKTYNGTGRVEDRLSASKFKKNYPEIILDIQNFFDTIKEPLIRRFLIDGVSSDSSAEFIYYGTVDSGICCKRDKVLEWVLNNHAKGAISIGRLNFQAWNRNLNGGDKSESKRGVIQLKWASIKEDLKAISDAP